VRLKELILERDTLAAKTKDLNVEEAKLRDEIVSHYLNVLILTTRLG
jgi:hypothetical protein